MGHGAILEIQLHPGRTMEVWVKGLWPLRQLRKLLGRSSLVHFLRRKKKDRTAAGEDNGNGNGNSEDILHHLLNGKTDIVLWSSFSLFFPPPPPLPSCSFGCGMILYNPKYAEISVYVLIIYARASSAGPSLNGPASASDTQIHTCLPLRDIFLLF